MDVKRFRYSASFNKQNLKFLNVVSKYLRNVAGDIELSDKIDDFYKEIEKTNALFEFDNGTLINALCPYHEDRNMGSITHNANNDSLMCWACKTPLTMYNFYTKKPVYREQQANANNEGIELIDKWCAIFDEMQEKYQGFIGLLNDPNFIFNNNDLIYVSDKEVYRMSNPAIKTYLSLMDVIVNTKPSFNKKDYKQIAYDFIKNRGFNDDEFVQDLHPFYWGKDDEEVQENIINVIASQDNKNLFQSMDDTINWLSNLNLTSNRQDNYDHTTSYVFKETKYNVLSNRVGLPIYDEKHPGDILNLNLRAVGDEQPKYLYLKKQSDYGPLQKAMDLLDTNDMDHIAFFERQNKKEPFIYLCEGIYDSLSLVFNNLNSGCAFTKHLNKAQIELLKENKNDPILAFDNDLSLNDFNDLALKIDNAKFFFPLKKIKDQDIKDWNDLQKKIFNKEYTKIKNHPNMTKKTRNDILNILQTSKKDLMSLIKDEIYNDEFKNDALLLNKVMYEKAFRNNDKYPHWTYLQLRIYVYIASLYASKENINKHLSKDEFLNDFCIDSCVIWDDSIKNINNMFVKDLAVYYHYNNQKLNIDSIISYIDLVLKDIGLDLSAVWNKDHLSNLDLKKSLLEALILRYENKYNTYYKNTKDAIEWYDYWTTLKINKKTDFERLKEFKEINKNKDKLQAYKNKVALFENNNLDTWIKLYGNINQKAINEEKIENISTQNNDEVLSLKQEIDKLKLDLQAQKTKNAELNKKNAELEQEIYRNKQQDTKNKQEPKMRFVPNDDFGVSFNFDENAINGESDEKKSGLTNNASKKDDVWNTDDVYSIKRKTR